MFKFLLCILVVILVFLVVHMSISKYSGNKENFSSVNASVDLSHPDFALRHQVASLVDESDRNKKE